jgi:uncharacterized protein YecE (DUF72 family)
MENILKTRRESSSNIRVGVAGWSYEDWRGVVYPANRPAGFHEAEYLSQFLPNLEINTSFYRPLRPEVSRVWAKRLAGAKDFRFTAKLYRGFTHERMVDLDHARAYKLGLEPLIDSGLFGCVLMQFPFSFRMTPDNLRHVLKLGRLFSQYPLVAEFRHVSWNAPAALGSLADNDIGFCNIDQPKISHCLPPTAHVTSSIGYIRFHGRNYEQWFNFREGGRQGRTPVQARYDYLYSEEQLKQWQPRIRAVAEQAQTTYVVTNNHFQGKAVVNALQVLAGVTEEAVDAPPTLLDRYPELYPIARNLPAQRTLFFDRGRRLRALPPQRTVAAAVYARA